MTQKGYLGLGSNALQVGDEVHVIHGSNLPFVLRKSDQPCLYRQTRHESQMITFPVFFLIGDCYVHKIMDGEACQTGGYGAVPFVFIIIELTT